MSAALRILRRHGTLIGVAIVLGYFWLHLPTTFVTARNLINVSQQMSMLAVVASAMTIVMAMGDFDLSVGSMASLSGVVAAVAFIAIGSIPLGVAAALAMGVVCFIVSEWGWRVSIRRYTSASS